MSMKPKPSLLHEGLGILVVDLQREFTQNLKQEDFSSLQQSIVPFLQLSYHAGLPILGMIDGNVDYTHIKEIHPYIDQYVHKYDDSAFSEKGVYDWIKKDNIEQLVVLGMNANECLLATLMDAKEQNYQVYSAKDIVLQGKTLDAQTGKPIFEDINHNEIANYLTMYYNSYNDLANDFSLQK